MAALRRRRVRTGTRSPQARGRQGLLSWPRRFPAAGSSTRCEAIPRSRRCSPMRKRAAGDALAAFREAGGERLLGSVSEQARGTRRSSGMKTLARPSDKAEILRRLRAVRPEMSRRWGRMSAHQMVCHLSDSFRMATGSEAGERGGRAASPHDRQVDRPVPSPAVAGGNPRRRPEIDQEIGGTRPVDFAADVAELEALVDLITTQSEARRLASRIRFSAGCRRRPGFAGPTSTWITTFDSSARRKLNFEPPSPLRPQRNLRSFVSFVVFVVRDWVILIQCE